jgi:hypothetical protein
VRPSLLFLAAVVVLRFVSPAGAQWRGAVAPYRTVSPSSPYQPAPSAGYYERPGPWTVVLRPDGRPVVAPNTFFVPGPPAPFVPYAGRSWRLSHWGLASPRGR